MKSLLQSHIVKCIPHCYLILPPPVILIELPSPLFLFPLSIFPFRLFCIHLLMLLLFVTLLKCNSIKEGSLLCLLLYSKQPESICFDLDIQQIFVEWAFYLYMIYICESQCFTKVILDKIWLSHCARLIEFCSWFVMVFQKTILLAWNIYFTPNKYSVSGTKGGKYVVWIFSILV